MGGFFSLRRRIIITLVSLLALTTGSTITVLYFKLRDAAARGDYLSKHISRYEAYQDVVSRSLLASAQAFAARPDLAEALENSDRQRLQDITARFKGKMEGNLPMDAILVVDANLKPVSTNEELTEESALVRLCTAPLRGQPVRGTTVHNTLGALQVAAAPIEVQGRIVGAVLLARSLQKTFSRYSLDSDDRESKRHQLAMLVDGNVVAATTQASDNPSLLEGLENIREVPEGSLMAKVMTFKGKDFDVTTLPAHQLTPEGEEESGTLHLFRVRSSFTDRVNENLWPVIYVGFGALILALLLALLLASTITRPITTFTRSISSIAAGEADLTQRLEVKGNDELAHLAIAINELFENINNLVWKIRDSSLRLGQSSQEIAHVAMRTLEGARGQVDKIENSTSLSNELSRTIQEIASRANQGAQIATHGRDSVQRTDDGMASIRRTVHLSWEQVRALKDSVEKVGTIAGLISKITEENSMLALNASIEAARAGAAGQGFAVVAQQMREQARRVDKSSKEIIDNIESIQTVTADLVVSMEGARTDVESGSKLVNVTLHHLTELSTIMGETAESVKEQAAASDEIAQMMLDVQRIGHEALEASQQTVEEGESIRDKAQQLSTLVGHFQVRELSAGEEARRKLISGRHGDGEVEG